MSDPDDYADLVDQGQWEAAIAAISNGILLDPGNPRYYFNRACCNLGVGRLQDSLDDFQQAESLQMGGDSYPIMIGVALWLLGQREEAVGTWKRALSASYTDAAGGVIVPGLMLFASLWLKSQQLEQDALDLLATRWNSELIRVWPGPIAGYLLGLIDESTFLINHTFQNQLLEFQRRCKAHFWVAVHRLHSDDREAFIHNLGQVVQSVPLHHLSMVISQPEFWLSQDKG